VVTTSNHSLSRISQCALERQAQKIESPIGLDWKFNRAELHAESQGSWISESDQWFNARCSIVQNYIEQRAVDLQSAVVVNETQFSEPIMKKLLNCPIQSS